VTTPHTVVYLRARDSTEATRFGFIVTKAIGNAVTRNLVRRRMRSVGHDVLAVRGHGCDVVIRALPGSEKLAWATLHEEISDAIDRGVSRQ